MELPATYLAHSISSFSAFIPLETSLRTERIGHYEYLCGEYAARREVFADYYRVSGTKGVEYAPHVLFAKSGESADEIRDFTLNWGPLRPNTVDDEHLRLFCNAGPHEATPGTHFVFLLDGWRAQRRKLAEAMELISSDKVEDLRWLLPYRQPEMGPVKPGGLYPFIDNGTPIEVLERLWMADGAMTKREVRETAERCGLFYTEKGGPKYRLIFEAVSLMDAFWQMLFIDLTVRKPMVRVCANPKCRQPYYRQRSDKKYCTPVCALRAAKLAYYHRTGKYERMNKKSQQGVT